MNKTVKIIMNVILILIIIVLCVYVLLRFTNKVEIYKVETGSMENGIHAGDYIMVLKNTNYSIGDVVTYEKNNSLITHRIIKKDGDKIITKGDANNVEDEEISKSDIIGKVILKGGILNFIVNFKYAIIFLFLSIYLFTYYFDSKKKENN